MVKNLNIINGKEYFKKINLEKKYNKENFFENQTK